ncbi:MAG: universal stress protein [Pseudomonadota bacterium]
MKRFKKVLLVPAALTLDDAAIQRAIRLCKASGAHMSLCWPQDASSDGGTGLDYMPDVIASIEGRLSELTDEIRSTHDISIDYRLDRGKLYLEVIRAVQHDGYDLVMKTARGKSVGQQMLFGGDARQLLRKCPCPVWIVDPKETDESAVLAAVDPMTSDAEAEGLTTKILQLATSLAAIEDTEIHVVHAWAPPSERLRRNLSWLALPVAKGEEHIDTIRDQHREALDKVLEPFRDEYPNIKTHLVRGLAEQVIPGVAMQINAGTLVMATLARSGIPGLLIGNTAEVVLNDINRSVLVAKPDGFVSPLTLEANAD